VLEFCQAGRDTGLEDGLGTPQSAETAASAPARALRNLGWAANGLASVSLGRATENVRAISGLTTLTPCRYRSASPASTRFGVTPSSLPVHEWHEKVTHKATPGPAVRLSDDFIIPRSPAASLLEVGLDDPENQLGACQQQLPQLAGMTQQACKPSKCLWSSAQVTNVDMWFHAFTPVDHNIISSPCVPPMGGQLPVHPPDEQAEVGDADCCHATHRAHPSILGI
jgi:hypothetical protein